VDECAGITRRLGETPLGGHSMAWSKAKENCEQERRNPTSTQESA